MNTRGIFSLSKTNDNILMWSHYAKNHTGIVIEFDVLEDIDFFTTPLNVSYQKSYQPLDYLSDRKNAVIRTVSLKSHLWEYEEEVRVVKDNFGLVSIAPKAIKKVYFGCEANSSDIQKVKSICRQSGLPHVKYYKASVRFGEFALVFHSV